VSRTDPHKNDDVINDSVLSFTDGWTRPETWSQFYCFRRSPLDRSCSLGCFFSSYINRCLFSSFVSMPRPRRCIQNQLFRSIFCSLFLYQNTVTLAVNMDYENCCRVEVHTFFLCKGMVFEPRRISSFRDVFRDFYTIFEKSTRHLIQPILKKVSLSQF
jgi:hypothetical protein